MNAAAADAKKEGPAVSPMLVAMVVSLAAFMEVLDTTITNVSLSHIAGSLAASQDESTWVLTSYLVANGIVLPLSGWLSNVMGRKNFFMMCIAGFTVASFACGMATSLPMLIVFRLIQGLAGGGLQPTQQAIIMDSFPPEKRGTAFGITGITMIVAPILGPTLGGYITDNFNWRWIFFMNVPVGIMAVLLVRSLVTDPPHARAQGVKSIDYIGLGLLAVGLGALQIMLDKGQEDDWFDSRLIDISCTIAVLCLGGAVMWLLRQKDAIVDLRLMKQRAFGSACLMIFFVGFSLYGASALLPLLLQSSFGYDATLAGLVLSPGGISVIILMPIVGRMVNRVQARYLIAFGMFITAVGMFLTMHFTPQTDYNTFVMLRILQVGGLPFLFVPISTMAFSAIPKEKSGKASALYSLMRNLGGSFGISALLTFLERREQTHQNFMVEHLTPANHGFAPALARATANAVNAGYGHGAAVGVARGLLYRQMESQSMILGYADSFYALAIVMFGLSLFALTLPTVNLHKKKSADAAPAH
jgi:DHA2 family multidrug resistance protein